MPSNTPATAESPYMTMTEISARYAGASRSWIYSSSRCGDLPPMLKIGGKLLFSRAAVIAKDAEREAIAERRAAERLAEQEAD